MISFRDKITTKIYDTNDKRICDLLLSCHLHYGHGILQDHLVARRSPYEKSIAVAWHKGQPIGVAYIDNAWFGSKALMVYVKEDYRRYGIGSKLISRLPTKNCIGYIGYRSDARAQFWDSNKINKWGVN